jgi:hypothetical protein
MAGEVHAPLAFYDGNIGGGPGEGDLQWRSEAGPETRHSPGTPFLVRGRTSWRLEPGVATRLSMARVLRAHNPTLTGMGYVAWGGRAMPRPSGTGSARRAALWSLTLPLLRRDMAPARKGPVGQFTVPHTVTADREQQVKHRLTPPAPSGMNHRDLRACLPTGSPFRVTYGSVFICQQNEIHRGHQVSRYGISEPNGLATPIGSQENGGSAN